MARKRKPKGVKVDFTDIGKSFEAGKEYRLKVTGATLEEGQKGEYFKLEIKGATEDYENSTMYHNASCSPQALWRLRPWLEALQIDIPDGPMDLTPEMFMESEEFMGSTYLDKYDGGASIKIDEVWPVDEADDDEDEEEEAKDFDLDDLDDDDIMKLAAALEIKARVPARAKKAIRKLDDDEVAEAWAELDDADEGEKGDGISKEDVLAMNEDELEELIEEHDLDVDLDDFKTLKRKKNAVVDALEEEDLLED